MPTNLEYRKRKERQRKRESWAKGQQTQRPKKGLEREGKNKGDILLVGETT